MPLVQPAVVSSLDHHRYLYACLAVLTALELSPANELIRVAAWASSASASRQPVVGGAAYGGATLLVEALGVVAGAPLLTTGSARRTVERINEKAATFLHREARTVRVPIVARALAALFGGAIVSMALRLQSDPSITERHLRRHGLWVTGALTVLCAIQGALMSLGVGLGLKHPAPVLMTIGAVAVVTGIGLGARRYALGRRES